MQNYRSWRQKLLIGGSNFGSKKSLGFGCVLSTNNSYIMSMQLLPLSKVQLLSGLNFKLLINAQVIDKIKIGLRWQFCFWSKLKANVGASICIDPLKAKFCCSSNGNEVDISSFHSKKYYRPDSSYSTHFEFDKGLIKLFPKFSQHYHKILICINFAYQSVSKLFFGIHSGWKIFFLLFFSPEDKI